MSKVSFRISSKVVVSLLLVGLAVTNGFTDCKLCCDWLSGSVGDRDIIMSQTVVDSINSCPCCGDNYRATITSQLNPNFGGANRAGLSVAWQCCVKWKDKNTSAFRKAVEKNIDTDNSALFSICDEEQPPAE